MNPRQPSHHLICPSSSSSPGTGRIRGGFSLIELLTVIALIGLISGLTMASIGSLSSAYRLTGAASHIADLAEFARQNAIASGSPTRLVVGTMGWSETEKNYRTVNVVQRQDATGVLSWSALRRWDELPAGVSFSREATGTGTPLLSAQNTNSSMDVPIAGGTLQSKYIEFLPSGQVRPEYPGGVSLILVRGDPSDHEGDDKGDNWVEITVHPVTGKVAIHRP